MTANQRTEALPIGAPAFSLERLGVVMSPLAGEPTEALGVLNPATARRGAEVYLFPRLVAEGNYSRIGRARVIFDAAGIPVDVERLGVVLEPQEAWGLHAGGGGVEDPRITYMPRLSRWIMTYVAYGPFGPRIGLATSADLERWDRLGPVSSEGPVLANPRLSFTGTRRTSGTVPATRDASGTREPRHPVAGAGRRSPETWMTDSRPIDIVVLAKQVPDTHNITGDVMTKDGTMNRGALSAIFNPEDLNALEMALQIKDRHGGTVTVITMGPPKAANILRESLWRGADRVVLLTDRRFAGADTLATSLVLQKAIEKIGRYDLILAGRQAIDGDTAQVGPQTAEKLGIPQITYAESVLEIADGRITAQRALDSGSEIVRCQMPCLLTVVGSANTPRPPSVRRQIARKLAATSGEYAELRKQWPEFETDAALEEYLSAHDLKIPVWTADDIGATAEHIGLAGSPTQVHRINFVVLESTESKTVQPTPEAIAAMVAELVHEYIVG